MSPSISQTIITELMSQRNPNRAAAMEQYMRNQFPFFGVMATPRRAILKETIKSSGLPPLEHWKNEVTLLWENEYRECQLIGMELARKCHKHWKKEDYSFLENLITTKSWWDTVDYIASNIIGYYFNKYEHSTYDLIPKMNASPNIWMIRTSIIFQLKYGPKTDVNLLFSCIVPHLSSNEFFIQKAIGWALRQYAKYNPNTVLEFVDSHDLKPLSKKEALKHF